ncbi:E3 ubiquitin-protein ligase TRIM39-like [Bufo gargarizans]|uniref:E3 ubiquitin-protein ligase TRIM39-like n=1 Tax=Bufo gargarizans TaxID=30331 RepID=UPI001CF15F52|nr:E3 ubiquitin-protein ligase TRIM39-like [Bufo gargarizans]
MCHNPVTLSCGHNFCLDCIENTWDNQDKDISCPLCKQRFKKRPELKRNIILSQIEELCQSSKSSKKSDGFCTYCLHDNVPVAKSCLLCQALLCGDHLTVHSKNGEHVLLEPSPSLENRRCFIHNRVLEFYCVQDSLCICACCCIMGEHKEHPVELAKDAMEKKKIQLRDILENLTMKKAKIVKSIKVCRKAEQRNVSAARGAGDVVVQEIRDSLGAEVLGDMQEGQSSASELIKHLEARHDELLHDIESIEELCYVTDPILLLRDQLKPDGLILLQELSALLCNSSYLSFRFLLLRTTMASADLSDELDCSICLSLYTDPVSLRCGHNFCRSCIVSALDAQEAAGVYSCPDCRAEYPGRPNLEKNRKLRNIVERFSSAQPDMEETYCTKSPVPAVRTCLHCEASMCHEHLGAHNKSVDHSLIEPTVSFLQRKCSTHKEVLKYYCAMDAACICVSCWVAGDHKGHDVELLDVAFEKEKEKLRKYLEELNPQKAEIQSKLQNLQDRQRNIQEKASDKRKKVRKLFMDIKKQLEMAEKKALSEISRQKKKIVSPISDLIKKLEIEEGELSRKMRHVEEMCHVTDPIRLLQEGDITVCGHGDDEDKGGDGGEGRSEDGLDEVLISLTLHRSMRDIVTKVTSELGLHVPDILLDEDTANRYMKISEDLKTATRTEEEQNRPESPGRFLNYPQVLSRCGLSSGRHYWEVEWNQIVGCNIGLSYPSIERKGWRSSIMYNDKSWCLVMSRAGCEVFNRSVRSPLSVDRRCPRLGVFLDYEAGRLSFYQLCDPIRHLHTFTASFSEPLHVLFCLWPGASVRIIS